jgi:hypothetical protein
MIYIKQAASSDSQFASIYEYNFRLNKKWLNFYIFSEQEYLSFSLEEVVRSKSELIIMD